jgi:glycosyltransferase involved in cell wall biosynthesis
MTIKAKVSVVVAFHNGSKWIERALQSIAEQTVTADEVLVVDDGSSPEESAFLTALQDKYPFRIIPQENGGQSSARNRGFSEAKNEFVCLLDQDDYYLPRHIELLLEAADFNDPKFAFSYGDLWRVSESGLVLAQSCVNLESTHPHVDLKALVGTNMYILPSATLIKREVFLAIGGYDVELRGYEDDDLFLRLFLAGYTNRFISEAVTAWTVNTSSTSFSESMARSRFIYFKKLVALFPEGSVVGSKVFGDLLFKRFAQQFAKDVVASAFSDGLNFAERVARLAEYRRMVISSVEVPSLQKRKYLISTYPLVTFGPKVLRFAFTVLLKTGILTILPGFRSQEDVIRGLVSRKNAPRS